MAREDEYVAEVDMTVIHRPNKSRARDYYGIRRETFHGDRSDIFRHTGFLTAYIRRVYVTHR